MIGKFNLAKLEISGYEDRNRIGGVAKRFQAMFNPESISQRFSVNYTEAQSIGATSKQLNYMCRPPTELRMTLILDHSLHRSALEAGIGYVHNRLNYVSPQYDVSKQVKCFLETAYDIDSGLHQPRWLTLRWGERSYSCRLASVEIAYTGFDRSGVPIAAELDILLKEDLADATAERKNNLQSPDVTHLRIVKVGDTLPLLSQQVYGDPSYYSLVAQANNLDDFRNLQPGLSLYFPPLT